VAATTNGQAGIAARLRGATAGVTRQGGQAVFSSSAAPKSAKAGQRSSSTAPARSSARTTAPARSTRGATGDLWSGVATAGSPSLASASAAGAQSGGLGTAGVAGLVILGLGLSGLTAGFLVTTGRRRRVAGARKR
jgi:hypothetical protein